MLTVCSKKQKRLKLLVDNSMDKVDNDFNLANLITDYKERQRDKALTKMRSRFRELFVRPIGMEGGSDE